jgi:hypothetical protein
LDEEDVAYFESLAENQQKKMAQQKSEDDKKLEEFRDNLSTITTINKPLIFNTNIKEQTKKNTNSTGTMSMYSSSN